MAKYRQIISPHSHSDHSLDGAATVKQIIKRNVELGATHVTLTEHGTLNSAMELYTKSIESNVKPILGIEAYLVNPFHDEYVEMYRQAYRSGIWKPRVKDSNTEAIERAIQAKAMNQYLHITVHFKDEWAYKYFCGLSKAMWGRAVKKYNEMKPMITMDELRAATGHITIGSGCMKGPLQSFLLSSRDGIIKPDPEKSLIMHRWLKDITGTDGFFVEVFPHAVTHEWQRAERDDNGTITQPGHFKPHECTCEAPDGDLQKPLNLFCIDVAEKNNDKVIISLDSHFAYPRQKVIQDARLGNGEEGWRFSSSYHIMSTDEAAEMLQRSLKVDDKTIEKWVDNSYAFASNFDHFKLQTSKDRWVLAGDGNRFLSKLKSTIDKWGRMDWSNQEMLDQLKREIQILAYNGKINLLSYIETIEDIASFCRDNSILMGVRGSGGGSLLLYLIGVSGINPLKHGLSFGRFLTEGRIKANTLPDVDMDVSDQEGVIRYLTSKYGENVCRLSTDLLLRLKLSIRDIERAELGRVRPETEKLCTKLPGTPQGMEDRDFVFGKVDKAGNRTPGLLETNSHLKKYADDNPKIWSMVTEALGIIKTKSTHACGFLIADRPITEYMPIIKVNDEWVTGFSPKSVEAAGGVKFDLLGLNTLREIQLCLRSIKERSGITLEWNNLPYNIASFDEFGKGITSGVFQFDTPTIRPFVMKVKPRDIDAMAALTALGRPGTLAAPHSDGRTLADVYVARANGEPTHYLHPDLEPILKETYGIQLYQEQTIQIFKTIGGMDDAEADEVRRGIGKKIAKVLADATDKLRTACVARGWTEEQVSLLMEQVNASANYSFNKSHAISYAYVAYACLYLRVNYPLDWWKAILQNSSKEELATKFWRHVQDFTSLPDINKSKDTYEIVGDRIVAPFSILSGVGDKTYADLMKHKPYADLEHFVRSHFPTKEEETAKKIAKKRGDVIERSKKSAVNAGIARKLTAAGVLDSMFNPGDQIDDKLTQFEAMCGQVRGKRPKRIPVEYDDVTTLGKYLLKKQLIQIHSEDLRPMMLSNRGGRNVPVQVSGVTGWFAQDGYPVLDGNQLEYFKTKSADPSNIPGLCRQFDSFILEKDVEVHPSVIGEQERRFYVLAYTISEKAFPYKNKSKYANRMVLDVNGFFTEDMLWPPKDKDVADMGFKGLPILASYYISSRGVTLGSVQPLLSQGDMKTFNMV